MSNFDMPDFLKELMGCKETKEEVLDKYVRGEITVDEFIKRMKKIDRSTLWKQ